MRVSRQQIEIIAPVILFTDFLQIAPFRLPASVKCAGIFLLVCYGFLQYRRSIFDKALLTVFIGLCLSMVSCQIYRGQPIIRTTIAQWNFWSLFLYYFYMRRDFSSGELLSALTLLGKTVAIVYVIQYVLIQFGISLNPKYDDISDGAMARMRIHGSAAIYFLYFRYLQLFLKTRDKKALFWIVFAGLIALIMNFRSILAAMALFTLVQMWMQHVKLKTILYTFFVACVIGGAMLTTDLVSSKIDQIMERQKTQTLSNKNYIRVIGFQYYLTRHHKNNIERFLGSGFPSGKTDYGKHMSKLSQNKRIFYVDWGIIGLSWILGITTLFGILWYVIIATRARINNPCVAVWLMFLVLASITTCELYRGGNLMVQAIALAYIAKREKRLQVIIKRRRMLEDGVK